MTAVGRKAGGQRRTMVTLRLTDHEVDLLKAAAERRGVTVSEFVRAAALGAAAPGRGYVVAGVSATIGTAGAVHHAGQVAAPAEVNISVRGFDPQAAG